MGLVGVCIVYDNNVGGCGGRWGGGVVLAVPALQGWFFTEMVVFFV